MPTVALKALTLPPTPDGYQYFDMIEFRPGTPPDRPRPQPPDPKPPNGGYHPAFPIAPGGGEPGWPDKPGYPDYIWGDPIIPPVTPSDPPRVMKALVGSVPAGVTPPAAPPADAAVVLIDFGKGTKPTYAWVSPYVSTGPIDPPEGKKK